MEVITLEGEPQRFTMPSDMAGPRCDKCDTVLPDVYKTERMDLFIFRQRICPNCGRKNVTLERSVQRDD